jgi:hemolysin activation/secretion protein
VLSVRFQWFSSVLFGLAVTILSAIDPLPGWARDHITEGLVAQAVSPSTTEPNRERFVPPNLDLLPLLDEPALDLPTELPAKPQPNLETPIQVSRIDVQGSTIFSRDRLASILAPLEGRTVSLSELQAAADAITQLYIERGYITSRAILADQTIQNGLVLIQVIEGKLTRIEVQGNRRVNQRYIIRRIRLGAKVPLKTQQLEDQLRLLKINPLFKTVEGRLKPGDRLGETALVVQVTEAPSLYFTTFADNYSPPDVGSERFGLGVGSRNLTGFGDAIGVAATRSTNGGSSSLDFNYQLPVNARNGTLQLRATRDYTKITSSSS